MVSSSSSTSLSLVEGVRQFDSEAWQRMCELYGPFVYRWARNAGLQQEDAADIGQEVFRTVAARIGTFRKDRDGDTFRGWLFTITKYKLGDYFRMRAANPQGGGGSTVMQRFQEVPELPLDESTDASGFDVNSSLVHRTLQIIRTEFEDSTWQAFWRVTVDGQAAAVVAEDLGITPQAVRQAKYRVLRRLRAELRDATGD